MPPDSKSDGIFPVNIETIEVVVKQLEICLK